MNKYIIGCVVLLSILIVTFLLIKTRKNTLQNTTMENISPYVMLGSLKNKEQKVVLVNVLSEKIPFLINCVNSSNNLNLTKAQFEEYLKENKNLENTDLVIIYCASWSCGAAKGYYDELKTKGLNMEKVFDYKGALHEWAMYSVLFPQLFTITNLSTNQNASMDELKKLAKDMMHTYLLKDEKESKNNTIISLSGSGENIVSGSL